MTTLDNFNNNCGKITAKPVLPSAPDPTWTDPDPHGLTIGESQIDPILVDLWSTNTRDIACEHSSKRASNKRKHQASKLASTKQASMP